MLSSFMINLLGTLLLAHAGLVSITKHLTVTNQSILAPFGTIHCCNRQEKVTASDDYKLVLVWL